MALFSEQKQEIIKKFKRGELDTGSSEVQIALLTARIRQLTEHFKKFKKDVHSRTGLIKMVSQRKRLLNYLRRTQPERYNKLIVDLELRK